MMSEGLASPAYSVASLVSVERHYSPAMVAELWHLDVETVRRIFQDQPGVVVLQAPAKKGRRPYKTLRIPESVLDRVHKRLQR
jgi:hypothetical protein